MNAPLPLTEREPVSVECRVYRSFLEIPFSQSVWDEALLELGGNIYLSFDWLKTWSQFYGDGKELRIFVYTVDEKIVGLLPLYIDEIGFRPITFRIARLIGSNIPPKAFPLPILPEFAEEIFARALLEILEKDRCDVLSLGPVCELQKAAERLEAVCAQSKDLVKKVELISNVHTIFWTPESMEKYFEGLGKHEKKNRRKYELRLLSKEFNVKVEVISDPALVDAEFERFAKQHAEQWEEERKPGHFGSWPKALEYNRALVRAHAPLGRIRFIRIMADDEVIANQYTFSFGDSYIWELPARAVNPKWSRFSLGPTGIVTMIDCAVKEGKKSIEGGLAHYDYKLRLGAKEYSANTLRITAARPAAIARGRIFSVLRKLANIAYHKIWYRRVAPRLPKTFWRPQPMWWLRLDF